jgi:penicillin-binding protein 1C
MRIGKLVFNFRRKEKVYISILIIFSVFILISLSVDVPSFESVRNNYRPSDVWVVDRHGYPMESIRTSHKQRSLAWTKWEEISPAFSQLLIEVEDRRFYFHPGIDVFAIAKASWDRVTGNSQRGASTLTMQLVGLLHGDTFKQRRNLIQKFKQIISALMLNIYWSKEQVLEAYINLVSFRGEIVGLRAATLGHFGKNPSGINLEEAAILVSLLRSPNAEHDLVAKRACLVLKMKDCLFIENLSKQVLSSPYRLTRNRQLIPVLSKYFTSDDKSASVIQTTLDYPIQEMALNALREQLRNLKNQNVNDGAVLILETQTGRVVAYAANAGAGVASADQIDGIQTRRQAGSTIKPFVYATAFDWQLLNSTSLLEDSPADIPISYGRVYHPKNYDHIFRGLVSVGDALGSSMNVPAVRALQLVGESRVLDRLRLLGFEQLQDDEYYGPSLALGAIDVTLWELTQGYRQFAVADSAFSKSTRESIFNILTSPEYRRFTFGMDSMLTLPFSAAVKTGTSKDMRDNWCVGWTQKYTIGVWVGNFNGDPMWNVSGMSGAAPIWRGLMMALHTHPNSTLSKYESPSVPLPRRTMSRIRYPADDMMVGLDPDIPKQLQKLPIEIENPQMGHKIFLNNRLLSKAQETILWPIKRGKYLVELKTTSGELVDSLKFEVR